MDALLFTYFCSVGMSKENSNQADVSCHHGEKEAFWALVSEVSVLDCSDTFGTGFCGNLSQSGPSYFFVLCGGLHLHL